MGNEQFKVDSQRRRVDGMDRYMEGTAEQVGEKAAELTRRNWRRIKADLANDDKKATAKFSASFTLCSRAEGISVEADFTHTDRGTDNVSGFVNDPDQTDLFDPKPDA